MRTIFFLILFSVSLKAQTISLGGNASIINNFDNQGMYEVYSPSLTFRLPFDNKYISLSWASMEIEYYRLAFGSNINKNFCADMGVYYFNRGTERIFPKMFGGDLGVNHYIKLGSNGFGIVSNIRLGFSTEFLFANIGIGLTYRILN